MFIFFLQGISDWITARTGPSERDMVRSWSLCEQLDFGLRFIALLLVRIKTGHSGTHSLPHYSAVCFAIHYEELSSFQYVITFLY